MSGAYFWIQHSDKSFIRVYPNYMQLKVSSVKNPFAKERPSFETNSTSFPLTIGRTLGWLDETMRSFVYSVHFVIVPLHRRQTVFFDTYVIMENR